MWVAWNIIVTGTATVAPKCIAGIKNLSLSKSEGCPVLLPTGVLGSSLDVLTNPRPWGQDKSVCHFKAREKKKQWNIHSLSVALTLTLTATLSPNHYTMSNFGRPCTHVRLRICFLDFPKTSLTIEGNTAKTPWQLKATLEEGVIGWKVNLILFHALCGHLRQ